MTTKKPKRPQGSTKAPSSSDAAVSDKAAKPTPTAPSVEPVATTRTVRAASGAGTEPQVRTQPPEDQPETRANEPGSASSGSDISSASPVASMGTSSAGTPSLPSAPSAEAAPSTSEVAGEGFEAATGTQEQGPSAALATVAEVVAAADAEPLAEAVMPVASPPVMGPSDEPELATASVGAPPEPERAPEPDAEPEPEVETEPAPVPEPAVATVPEPEPAAEPEPVPAPEPEPPVPHHPPRPTMFIVHITPELAPVAKVGGLADVVFGLAKEQEIRGNHVEVILPKYDSLRYDQIWGLTETYNDLWVPWYGGSIHCTVYFGFAHGRKCFFIEPHSADNFFNRGCIYGFNDDILRFAFFSRAALEFLWKSGKHPEIIHCHDWQTALVPILLYEIYQHLGMTHPRVCFTIHNFKHQGVTGANLLHATGLNRPEYYFHYDRLRDNHNLHALNLTKGGVVYSNFVTTVSPRHAMEAKDQGQGFGLEPTLHIHHQKYGGVLNGIDYEAWNPEIDRYIPVHYSVENIDDKYKNKIALRDRLLLADNEKPIVAFIGRLDPQKGLELLRHALFYTLHRNGQFVLLGSSPDSQINNYFWGLKHQLNENPDCHLEIGFNEELSHLIYAGADIVIVPSRFEPCGLTQMIAMRYGAIPVVREVGGLADTVFDKDYSHRPLHERNGYIFRDYDFDGLESALGRAISCYYEYPEHFRELMKNAMRYDYSWNHPGQDYMNIYDYIREK